MIKNLPSGASDILYGTKLKPGELELYQAVGQDFLAMLEANVPVVKTKIKDLLKKNDVVGMLLGGAYLKYFYYVLHRGVDSWPRSLSPAERKALHGLKTLLSFWGTVDYAGFKIPPEGGALELGIDQTLSDLAAWATTEFRTKLRREYRKITDLHASQVLAVWPHLSPDQAADVAWVTFEKQVALGLRKISFREYIEDALVSLLGNKLPGL